MGEKCAYNIISQLDSTRSISISAFLSAVGLPCRGHELETGFAEELENSEIMFNLLNDHEIAICRLVTLEGVGETVARSFVEGLSEGREMVEGLAAVIEISAEEAKQESEGPFTGQTFCITGSLSRPRKEMALMIKAAGGKVISSVSGKLDFLVAGESSGFKLDKANRISVTVLRDTGTRVENIQWRIRFGRRRM
jgi:NAD-dependent DNA ligase (contains BRCT domain type II)